MRAKTTGGGVTVGMSEERGVGKRGGERGRVGAVIKQRGSSYENSGHFTYFIGGKGTHEIMIVQAGYRKPNKRRRRMGGIANTWTEGYLR